MNKELLHLYIVAEKFCAYQERSKYEVEKKLKNFNLPPAQLKEILISLEENEYLNEERFAKLYTSGKFRIKKWGKIKIASELRIKKIPQSVIQNALNQINLNEYKQTIKDLIKKKERQLKKDTGTIKNQKILRFVLSKGFESSMIIPLLEEVIGE